MKALLLCFLILVPMVMAIDILPYDRDSLIPYCHQVHDDGTFNKDTCTYFLGQDIMASTEDTSCPKMKCATMTAACVATCVYQVPMCYPSPVKCADCLRTLYSMCCSCVLPGSMCSSNKDDTYHVLPDMTV